IRKIFVVILAFLFAGCSAQSGYPPPSQSERSQTIPARPDAVKEAEKNVLAITLVFKITGNDPLSMVTRTFVPKIEAGATGFMIKPGIVITARHLLVDSISELAKRGILSEIDPISEFPRSANGQYEYTFNATTNINGISEDFKLVPIAMGKLGQHKDYMALRAEKYPKNLKPLETEELKEQEFVYSSGYIPVFSSYPDANGRMISVLSDIIKKRKSRRSNPRSNEKIHLRRIDKRRK